MTEGSLAGNSAIHSQSHNPTSSRSYCSETKIDKTFATYFRNVNYRRFPDTLGEIVEIAPTLQTGVGKIVDGSRRYDI